MNHECITIVLISAVCTREIEYENLFFNQIIILGCNKYIFELHYLIIWNLFNQVT